MALTKISTGGVKDDAASQAKIADEAVDEARLQISNAGTDGQFLSKQSGNTGGLTWATVDSTPEGTVIKSTGEPTTKFLRADGDDSSSWQPLPTTTAHNLTVVDESSDTNCYPLFVASGPTGTKAPFTGTNLGFNSSTGVLSATKFSGDGSTLTNLPPAGNTFTAVADGAIATNKPVCCLSNGKVAEIKTTTTVADPPATQVHSQFGHGTPLMPAMAYDDVNDRFMLAWRSNDNSMAVHCRVGKVNTDGTITYESQGIVAVNSATSGHIDIIFISHGRFAICWCEYVSNAWTGKRRMATISESGGNFTISLGTTSNIGGNGGFTRNPKMVKISNTRIATLFKVDSGAYGTQSKPRVNVASIRPSSGGTPTGTSDTYIQAEIGTHLETSDNMSGDATAFSDGWFDSTNDILYFVYKTSNDDLKLAACTNSNFNTNFSNDLTLTIESLTDMHLNAQGPSVVHISGDNYVMYFYNKDTSKLSAMHFSVNSSTYAVTKQTQVDYASFNANSDTKATKTTHGNILVSAHTGNDVRMVSSTVSGTTVTWSTAGNLQLAHSGYGFEYLDQRVIGSFIVNCKIYNGGSKTVSVHTVNVSNIISNLATSGNYPAGWVDSAYSDGDTVTVKTVGNNQAGFSGLTVGEKYLIQGNGTIATSADSGLNAVWGSSKPIAGTAIKSDTLLISSPHSQ